jgi:hypothetical protein
MDFFRRWKAVSKMQSLVNKQKRWITGLGLPLLFVLLITNCQDNDSIDNDLHKWQSLGFEGKLVPELVLSDNYLYACAGKDGLFRIKLNGLIKWEYLGFADSTLFRELPYGVTSLFIEGSTKTIFLGIGSHKTSGTGLFRSEDNGETWMSSDSGISTEQYPRSTDISSINGSSSKEDRILVGLTTTVYLSIDGGLSWNLVWGNRDAGGLGINAIRFNSAAPNNIWAGGETGRFAPIALRSTNSGETWELIYPLPPLGPYGVDNAVYDIAVDPAINGTIYLGMLGLIMKTTDAGKTWHRVLGWEDTIHRNWRLAINPNNSQELLATGSRLYRTTDGGQSWQKILPPDERIALYALAVDWGKRVLYASASSPGNGIYKLTF